MAHRLIAYAFLDLTLMPIYLHITATRALLLYGSFPVAAEGFIFHFALLLPLLASCR
jgi:hypothetical protein